MNDERITRDVKNTGLALANAWTRVRAGFPLDASQKYPTCHAPDDALIYVSQYPAVGSLMSKPPLRTGDVLAALPAELLARLFAKARLVSLDADETLFLAGADRVDQQRVQRTEEHRRGGRPQ